MKPIFIHDKTELERYLLKNRELYYYHLGDLDDFFWHYTSWYALREGEDIRALALLYTGGETATLLALADENDRPAAAALIEALHPLLPPCFYSHFSPELHAPLLPYYDFNPGGEHYKMVLTHPEKLQAVDTDCVERLGSGDLPDLLDLYAASYPGNWFDARMLETGQYVGARGATGRLLSVAGIHVYSPSYQTAALGNITTRIEARGTGLATRVTAALCNSLLAEGIEVIGLNVKTDNEYAIRTYVKLGFEIRATYYEYMANLKNDTVK